MVLKTIPEKCKKDLVDLDTNQFSQFLGLRCPKCGEEIDLELLVNFFQQKKKS
jgi:phage FluMu protein Com